MNTNTVTTGGNRFGKTFKAKALTDSCTLFRKGDTIFCCYDSTIGEINYLKCAADLSGIHSPMRRVYLPSFLVKKIKNETR